MEEGHIFDQFGQLRAEMFEKLELVSKLCDYDTFERSDAKNELMRVLYKIRETISATVILISLLQVNIKSEIKDTDVEDIAPEYTNHLEITPEYQNPPDSPNSYTNNAEELNSPFEEEDRIYRDNNVSVSIQNKDQTETTSFIKKEMNIEDGEFSMEFPEFSLESIDRGYEPKENEVPILDSGYRLKSFSVDLHKISFHKEDDDLNQADTSHALHEPEPISSMVFKTSFALKGSLKKQNDLWIQSDEKTYSCELCSKAFLNTEYLEKHKETHKSEKKLSCDVCKKLFSRRKHLIQHKSIHTGEKPYKCRICDKSFLQKGNLICHERIHTGEKPFTCRTCNKLFSRKANCIKHERIHEGVKLCSGNSFEQSFSPKISMDQHEMVDTEEDSSSRHLDLILRKETNTGQHAGDICEKPVIGKQNLIKYDINQTAEMPFSCNLCDKYFSCSSSARRHERIHKGEKPYSCIICEKSFSRKQHLLRHEMTHTGEKPYTCKMCEKSFQRKQHLSRHEMTHTGEKPYTCKMCEKSFSVKEYLIQHEKIHTGEKPFTCEICEKSFSAKRNLNIHKKSQHQAIHFDEKLHKYAV